MRRAGAFDCVLRPLNAQIIASGEAIEVRGEVPRIAEAPQSFATIERTWASLFQNSEMLSLPFGRVVQLGSSAPKARKN